MQSNRPSRSHHQTKQTKKPNTKTKSKPTNAKKKKKPSETLSCQIFQQSLLLNILRIYISGSNPGSRDTLQAWRWTRILKTHSVVLDPLLRNDVTSPSPPASRSFRISYPCTTKPSSAAVVCHRRLCTRLGCCNRCQSLGVCGGIPHTYETPTTWTAGWMFFSRVWPMSHSGSVLT